jgi:hypothetical protein
VSVGSYAILGGKSVVGCRRLPGSLTSRGFEGNGFQPAMNPGAIARLRHQTGPRQGTEPPSAHRPRRLTASGAGATY